MRTANLLCLALITILIACKKEPATTTEPPAPPQEEIKAPPAFGFYIVGYFPYYQALADVPDVKFRMCNVVNYAFFAVNSTGTLTVQNPGLVPQVVSKAKANGAKVMVSINDEAAGNFKKMAATAAGRTQFIKDVMLKVRTYGFDGVDIDWEYPTTSDGSDITFTALMKELSDSLHRGARYYLTAAITPGKYAGGARDAIRAEIFPYVDFFNIMAYDDFSTDPNQLYRHHSDYNLALTSLNYWVNTRGMPASKAVLGFPGYGRPSGISGNTMAYRNILARGGSASSDSAFVTSTNFPQGYKVYYNGQPTVKRKTMLAKQQANGVMLWEMWHDTPDATSLLKAVNDTLGRSY